MSSHDYGVYRRETISPEKLKTLQFDEAISAFNDSERVGAVFELINASRKHWLIHGEYGYTAQELPPGKHWTTVAPETPIEAWERLLRESDIDPACSLVIDITGMVRPFLVALPLMLRRYGFSKAQFLYSDPQAYVSGQSTQFSRGPVESVDVLPGFGGLHRTSHSGRDCLIIGAGYDHDLVRAVAEHKRNAEHFLLVGLPALQPHMYQESVYRVARVKESLTGFRERNLLFAPASNPFMVAQVLSDQVSLLLAQNPESNIYLAPVGPKTQVLGFSWYFLCEGSDAGTSIIFPNAAKYNKETSRGIETIHSFSMELDAISSTLSL